MHTLPALLDKINAYAAANPFPPAPRELYDPCDYILTLGGKRLRPALVLMAYELFQDNVDQALPAAWAVELFHNFTLMHDDIMDAAPLRRGKPTVHTKWSATAGILSGDAMLIHAYRHLARFDDSVIVADLLDTFNRVAIEVCEGQQYDLNFETRHDVTLPEYIRMIELKTAVLLGGALEMGAMCARAHENQSAHLYEFGRLAGIAFQIQDDLLDTYGDPAKFGKQVGGDILQNKKTFLVLKTLEVASGADRHELEYWMKTGPDLPVKISAVRDIFNRNGIPDLVTAEKRRYQAEAFGHFDAVEVPETRKVPLRGMMEELLVREY
ncbi:MAG: polyprenyl synthetase family protein [Thermoanaerobaculia bacterium]|nr:polyprenyl synthetase family protein [Thermoanaerobaculia bacterium]